MSSYSNNNGNNNSNPNSTSYQFQQLKEELIFDPHQMLMSMPQQRFYNPALMQQQQQPPSQSSQQSQQSQQQQQQQPFLMNIPQTYTQSQPQQLVYAMPPLQTQQTQSVAPHHAYNQQQQQQMLQTQQLQQSQNNASQFYDTTIPNYLIMGQGTVLPNQTTSQPSIPYYNYVPPQQQQMQTIPPPAAQKSQQQQQLHQQQQQQFPPPQRTVRSKLQSSASGKTRSRSSINKGPAKKQSPAMSAAPPMNVIYPNFPERLQQVLPPPPLSRAPVRPDMTVNLTSKRAKRKSKFTPEQDDLIVGLKKKGKSWVEIAEITGVGSYLAARNRYQVIVGQQGNNNSSAWDNKDKMFLHQLLDAGELEKWRFICSELNKLTNKNFTDYECREMIRELFFKNPASFGVTEETIVESQRERKLTGKIIEQREQSRKKRAHVYVEAKYIDPQYRNYQTQLMPNNPTSATNPMTIIPNQQQQQQQQHHQHHQQHQDALRQ
ncbi:Adherence factor [Candida viswanathii]|uniref:Adherence factor n=1 Tax=Candida viswanathii TaxID=5486 RepID=A0A367XUG2_9ASCO|nr:Adherence factor [Candida viswanathii]